MLKWLEGDYNAKESFAWPPVIGSSFKRVPYHPKQATVSGKLISSLRIG
jgi:hypothetical protein